MNTYNKNRRRFYSKHYVEGVTKVTNQESPKLELVKKWMKNEIGNRSCRIADIGCSEGVFLDVFRKAFNNCDFIGVDLSAPSIEAVRKRGFEGHVCDIETERLPFKSASLDGAYCGDIIEHVFDVNFFFKELRRVLKRGGWLIITTPNINSFSRRVMTLFGMDMFLSNTDEIEHVRFFTKNSLSTLISSKEFRLEKAITINTVIPYFARIKIIKSGMGNLGEKIVILARK